MSLRIFSVVMAALLAFPCSVLAFQGYVQSFGDGGTIAWGSGEVAVVRSLATDDGEEPAVTDPLAIRKAASQARKQMLDMILSVRIDAKRTVSAYISDDRELATRVRGVVQNSPFERPAVFEDRGEIRVAERLRGKLAELVLPTTIQFQSGIPPKLSTSMEQSMSFEDGLPEEAGVGARGYTGVIIDARGYKVTPALAPVIYGQDGEGAYGAFLVSRASAIAKGVAAYANTSAPEALRERVGDRPLSVRALSAYGSWRTDLIISSPMARLVRAVMRSGDAMENCRLVIVVDAPETAGVDVGVLQEGDMPFEEQ